MVRSELLCGRTDEDLVERQALRPADGEGDDLGDVLCGDGDLVVEPLDALLDSAWVM
jgi:hypothetical protein